MAECKVCGAIVSEGSVYCQKCGKKLDEAGISAGKISAFLQEQMESSGTVETRQYCRELMEKIEELKFQEVEIHRSSLEGLDLTDLVYEKDDKLHINCRNSEDFLKLSGALLINEIDCLQTEVNGISQELHNDRTSKLDTAYDLFRRAMLTTGDAGRKRKSLDVAAEACIDGINQLKKEMNNHLELFQSYPKSPLKKLFCGISLQRAEGAYKQMQEALPWYCDAVRMLMCIDMQNKEPEKLNMLVVDEQKFLKQIRSRVGYKRLQEVVEANAKIWDEWINRLKVNMYCAEKLVSDDIVTVKILEEKEI